MPLIRDGEQAREIFKQIIGSGKSIPSFGTESFYTTEAIFIGAKQFKEEQQFSGNLPVSIAFTASYHDRQQLKNYSALADFREGFLAVKDDIERLARPDGPFHDLDVMVHLDHAQPGEDDWLIEEFPDFFASVMWDCSAWKFADNIQMVNNFVRKHRHQFVIEGAVDEIYNYSADNQRLGYVDNITSPEKAQEFLQQTGADLIVANLGTEHRRTEGEVKYHRQEAREISQLVGRCLVLHGSSSLNEKEWDELPADGVVKVNLWGNLEAKPSKKLVQMLIEQLHHQLSTDQIEQLVTAGYLSEKILQKEFKPSIHYLAEKYRRDEIYIPEALKTIKGLLAKLLA